MKHVIKGKHDTNSQYHYHMETQVCFATPRSDSLDVYPGSQWPDYTHQGLSNILNIPQSKYVYIHAYQLWVNFTKAFFLG